MSHAPKISVCLPTYNASRYLGETLESLVSQTFEDYEIIISDNQSTDETEDIVRDFARRCPKIQFYKNEVNLGGIPNFNKSFGYARGQYINFFSADDIMLSRSLEVKNGILDRYPGVGFVANSCPVIDHESKEISWNSVYEESCLIPAPDFVMKRPGEGLSIWIQSVMFRRSALDRVGLWDTRFTCSADYDLLLRCGLSFDVYLERERLTQYRVHSDNLTKKISAEERIRQILQVWSEMIDRINFPPGGRESFAQQAHLNLCKYLVVAPVIRGRVEEAYHGARMLQGWQGVGFAPESMVMALLELQGIQARFQGEALAKLQQSHSGLLERETLFAEKVRLLESENNRLTRALERITQKVGSMDRSQ